jgi:hypothetical protein
MDHVTQTDDTLPEVVRALVSDEIGRQFARLGYDPWHDPGSAATYANCSKAHLLKCIRQGRGPGVVGSGRMMRMRQSAIDLWLQGKRQAD